MTVGLELTHLAKEKTKTAHNVVFGAIMSVDQMRKINTESKKKQTPKRLATLAILTTPSSDTAPILIDF